MSKNHDEIEVTLARDANVGPKGGLRKADTSVVLPAVEARNLLIQGKARLTNPKKAETGTSGPVTLGATDNTGGAAPGENNK